MGKNVGVNGRCCNSRSFHLPPIDNSGLMLCGITLESNPEKTPDSTVHIGRKNVFIKFQIN